MQTFRLIHLLLDLKDLYHSLRHSLISLLVQSTLTPRMSGCDLGQCYTSKNAELDNLMEKNDWRPPKYLHISRSPRKVRIPIERYICILYVS